MAGLVPVIRRSGTAPVSGCRKWPAMFGRPASSSLNRILDKSNARLAASKPEVRHRNFAGRQEAADPRHCQGKTRHRRGKPRAIWPLQGQGVDGLHQIAAEQAERQADPGDGDHADAGGRGQDHHDGGPDRRAQPHRQEGDALPARAVARALFRHEGRCRRRRLCASGADGRHQPPLHRRFPRHHLGAQSALGADRQPHLLGQCARHRLHAASSGVA